MARLKERFDFENGALAAVRDAAKDVTGAYQDAARGLDTLKEWVLIEFGMPNTANAIHKLAHLQPQRFDVVGDLLHQRHILQIYPATAEYEGRPDNLDGVFESIIDMLQKVEDALRECVEICDKTVFIRLDADLKTFKWKTAQATRNSCMRGRCTPNTR